MEWALQPDQPALPLLGFISCLGELDVNGVASSAFFQDRGQLTDRNWPVAKQSAAFLDGVWRGLQGILRQSIDENAEIAAVPAVAQCPGQELELGFKSDVAHYSATLAPLRKRAVVIVTVLAEAA